MNKAFEELFILDLANNHQGDVGHAKKIIKEMSEASKKYKVKTAIKFQFRDLKTYIHKEKRAKGGEGLVDRFLSTNLSDDQFFELKRYVDSQGLLSACTPFDEISVKKIVKMNFDYIKIASCSARDWPLIEKIRETRIPLIVSTGGLSLHEIDEVVCFLLKKRKDFALMHCVTIYPTPAEFFDLERIRILHQRYPDLAVGWSTHEDPNDCRSVQLAYSLGARVFEKHIGKSTKKYHLNPYSANKKQIEEWFNSFRETKKRIHGDERASLKKQSAAIKKLSRGIFSGKDIERGRKIKKGDYYYAFPGGDSIRSIKHFEFLTAKKCIRADAALTPDNTFIEMSSEGVIEKYLSELRAFLKSNNFNVPYYNHIELSFHSGLDKFRSEGVYFIDQSRLPYIKKIVVMLPKQHHPAHRHMDRVELFTVISGDLNVKVDGEAVCLRAGQQRVIDIKKYHEFSTENGVIFEEISFTENNAKSDYKNEAINKIERSKRLFRVKEKIL